MELYLIRHGESEGNEKKIHTGWSASELTEKGRMQALETAKLIKHIRFDRVIVSDLLRTQQTAALVFPEYDHELESKIRENNVGRLADRSAAECAQELGQQYLDAVKSGDYMPFGGENSDEMADRIAAFMREMQSFAEGAEKSDKVAVVCHFGTIYHMLNYALECRLPKSSVSIKNCSVSKLSYSDGRWKLDCWNNTGSIN